MILSFAVFTIAAAHPSFAVARNRSRTYSPALIGGYCDGFCADTQLGSVCEGDY
jgi:hypothetical protein